MLKNIFNHYVFYKTVANAVRSGLVFVSYINVLMNLTYVIEEFCFLMILQREYDESVRLFFFNFRERNICIWRA